MAIKKLLYGVGVNDADYAVDKRVTVSPKGAKRSQKVIWSCPYYARWKEILRRCYSENHLKKRPDYSGCTVYEGWHLFSNFKAWMQQQDWEGKQLDKDLLVEGNKVYGPDTCVFVSNMVNGFINEKPNKRGSTLVGVFYIENLARPYRAQCRNPFTGKHKYLGFFATELEAHLAWLGCKSKFATQLADLQEDQKVANALKRKYQEYMKKVKI